MTIFGRVIKGVEHLQALPRGSVENEFFIYKGNGALDICYYPPRVEMTLSDTKRQAEKLP